jgi:hypothetical protein
MEPSSARPRTRNQLSQTLTTSRQRSLQCANKAILSSEAKGGVGNSYDLPHISDRRILHRAIDSERENSTLKPLNASAKPKTAKTLNFLVRSSAQRGSSLRNLKDFAPHSRETVIARCFPSAASPQAPPRPSSRQRAITAVRAELSARDQLCVNRFSILWLGARRKGIARLAVLPPPGKSTYRFTRRASTPFSTHFRWAVKRQNHRAAVIAQVSKITCRFLAS